MNELRWGVEEEEEMSCAHNSRNHKRKLPLHYQRIHRPILQPKRPLQHSQHKPVLHPHHRHRRKPCPISILFESWDACFWDWICFRVCVSYACSREVVQIKLGIVACESQHVLVVVVPLLFLLRFGFVFMSLLFVVQFNQSALFVIEDDFLGLFEDEFVDVEDGFLGLCKRWRFMNFMGFVIFFHLFNFIND